MTRSVIRALLVVAMLGAYSQPPDESADEVIRIQRHLEGVATAMKGADVRHLSEEQRRARAETLEWLDEYRLRRVFPHNHVLLDERTPVFVDPHGTPCAVGYLLLRSGEDELVGDVVRASNLARVPELAADPRLVAWLDRRGLTLAEAAWIQPEYGGTQPESERSSTGYIAATVGVTALTATLATYGLSTGPPTESLNWPRALSAAALLGHVGLIVVAFNEPSTSPGVAVTFNVLGAAVSAVLGTVRFNPGSADEGDAGGVSFTPYAVLAPDGGRVGLSIRY